VKNKNLRFDNHNRSTRRDGDRRTEKRGHACRTTVTRAFYVATSFHARFKALLEARSTLAVSAVPACAITATPNGENHGHSVVCRS
jgi:hypothetical protein